MNAGRFATGGPSAIGMTCPHDARPCPYGGCSLSLCSRHEFVPVAHKNPVAVLGQVPARAARNTPSGAAMRADYSGSPGQRIARGLLRGVQL